MAIVQPEYQLFTKEELQRDSPSRRDGMSVRAECAMRAQAGKLLSACALMLDLSHAPTMTAAMFLHRFYAHRSFIEYPESEWIVCTCIFLATKLDEEMRWVSDIVNVMYQLKHPRALEGLEVPDVLAEAASAGSTFNIDAAPDTRGSAGEEGCHVMVGQRYYRAKDQLLKYEQTVLRALGFRVGVTHPHKYLLNFCHALKCKSSFVQYAYGLLNDIVLYTTLTLQHPPATLAAGAINLTALLLEATQDLPHQWWQYFQMDMCVLEDIGQDALTMLTAKDKSQ
mmetsp:Transcript_14735/g.28353  ORF Transcript_14735/g.28353 Transcript_14735/m.28353 type:complete len:282 (-) Transcript_14735:159-1004(-)|eukprot:CAMPEP_0114238978 /NCGR_PEP_ID=MMETSP0058-20121206/8207_1 /TAXON_ID=36894 /ORGANISM="Pyramimonas parkeae, CCMP726" /LENGTH=281 /DNA_ID=CAMNT_0001351113 /DNA_START=246 /DNA_END=1091 /DNA_ORIENTATION=+